VGASQGGEVAFHALARSDAVDGAVCMNILLPGEVPASRLPASAARGIAFLRSRLAARLAGIAGDTLRVHLPAVIDFRKAYREDPDLYLEKRRDPLYVWSYGFASYRSVFAYDPPHPAAANGKPVLVVCGEHDPVVPAAHCRACFDRIGGPKSLAILAGCGHQLMHFHTAHFARLVDAWAREGAAGGWSPPPDGDREGYRRFVDEQASAAATLEPEYRLSSFDRLLCSIDNGSIAGGAHFFSESRATRLGRFVSSVVSGIDVAAWRVFAQHLPDWPASQRGARPDWPASQDPAPPAIAVIGCGDGSAIERLLETVPALREWRILGVDVDAEAVEEARVRFAGDPRVRLVAGDARDPQALPPTAFDVVYAHGILDHCAGHRALARSWYRALRPGGRLFYVTPDRNVATWIGFVFFGPRVMFPLGAHRDVHDYRRFARPVELDALLRDEGFAPLADPAEPHAALHRGIEYRESPPRIWLAARRRDATALGFELTRPRWWLGQGFRGEYLGIAEKREAAACART
jgi:SAM-dependent methyltransferase